jgi:hypothetical protein
MVGVAEVDLFIRSLGQTNYSPHQSPAFFYGIAVAPITKKNQAYGAVFRLIGKDIEESS